MLSALFSFLGGSVFRMIWGEVSAFVQKKQDHAFEIERMKLQTEMEDRAHQRTQEALRLQSELGIKTIEAQAEANVLTEEAQAFTVAMKNAMKPTGIYWVDAWNGIIRPAAATIALALWALKLVHQNFIMQDYDMEITGVVLGFFFADRSLGKRGK
jgi:hypothetical protein